MTRIEVRVNEIGAPALLAVGRIGQDPVSPSVQRRTVENAFGLLFLFAAMATASVALAQTRKNPFFNPVAAVFPSRRTPAQREQSRSSPVRPVPFRPALPSDDGPAVTNGLIAFADHTEGDPRPDVTDAQIFTINPDGTGRIQRTSQGSNFLPAFSPDGATLAFVSTRRTGLPEIWLMNVDGSNQRALLSGGDAILPAWSRDGKKLTFFSGRTGSPQIWVMNADGTALKQLTTKGFNTVPTWSPDGERIAFWSGDEGGFGQIWVMDANGGEPRQLTFPRFDSYTPNGSSANAPAWLWNDKIVYWSGIEHQYGQIWTMNSDGSNQRQLTFEPAPSSSDNPAWSPDGTKILFDTSRNQRPEIWVLDANGQNPRVLVPDLKFVPGRASWQPLRRAKKGRAGEEK